MPLFDCLAVSALVFAIALAGMFVNRKNLVVLLMCIELMLLAVNTSFVAWSSWWGGVSGQVAVFFVLTVAAAEAAIGLALLVVVLRNRRSVDVDTLDELKG
jgi:NADH-quinone oxidoreductase subunit K